MRRPPVLVLFVLFILFGVIVSRAGRYRDIFQSVCDLTGAHFYKGGKRLENFLRACESRAANLSLFTSSESLLSEMDDQLATLNTSHLSVYSPVEDRKLWQGEAVDTGIRSHYVDGSLVIYRVHPHSSAEAAGVHVGDEILALPGVEHASPWGAEHRAGAYRLRRAGQELSLNVVPAPLVIDESPKIFEVGSVHGFKQGRVARLEIPSFRSEFFEKRAWLALSQKLSRFDRLIVDVRENAGGNFVAMLRALSSFTCDPVHVGDIVQPRREGPIQMHFDDDTDDQHQLGELDRFKSLHLQTFAGYGCYRKPVTVLINSNTASVAEIFADAFFRRKNSRVWGLPTAGNVVLAVWYDLPALGPGYSMSIPEAVYMNNIGLDLEGRGVHPQHELYYDLKRSLEGRDSWVEDAVR